MIKVVRVFLLIISVVAMITIYAITPHVCKTDSQWMNYLELWGVTFALGLSFIMFVGSLVMPAGTVKGNAVPFHGDINIIPRDHPCDVCKKAVAVNFAADRNQFMCDPCRVAQGVGLGMLTSVHHGDAIRNRYQVQK